jgi:hypothetical protein
MEPGFLSAELKNRITQVNPWLAKPQQAAGAKGDGDKGRRKYSHTVPPDKTHPHLHPPLEGEDALLFSPFKGEIERGMGLKKYV